MRSHYMTMPHSFKININRHANNVGVANRVGGVYCLNDVNLILRFISVITTKESQNNTRLLTDK